MLEGVDAAPLCEGKTDEMRRVVILMTAFPRQQADAGDGQTCEARLNRGESLIEMLDQAPIVRDGEERHLLRRDTQFRQGGQALRIAPLGGNARRSVREIDAGRVAIGADAPRRRELVILVRENEKNHSRPPVQPYINRAGNPT